MALTWQQAAEVAVVLAGIGVVLRFAPSRRTREVSAFAIEATVIAALYSLWQYAGDISSAGVSQGFSRGRWVMRFEHDVHLPSERSVQNLILGHPLLVQGANLYYDTMHFTIMFVFLVWLFVRHRDRYPAVRNVLALTTFGCLIVQLWPVAPPRLLPGYVDTAAVYDQSVYALGIAADELSAMPSVHVAWAVLIGWYVVRTSPSRWRWIGALHAVLTVFVVVATGNHWWLDGIVAVAILAVCAWVQAGLSAVWRAALGRVGRDDDAPAVHADEDEPVGWTA